MRAVRYPISTVVVWDREASPHPSARLQREVSPHLRRQSPRAKDGRAEFHGRNSSVAVECSIVVPLCNEETRLPAVHLRLTAVMRQLAIPYEIIYVDNGSDDRTAEGAGYAARAGCRGAWDCPLAAIPGRGSHLCRAGSRRWPGGHLVQSGSHRSPDCDPLIDRSLVPGA